MSGGPPEPQVGLVSNTLSLTIPHLEALIRHASSLTPLLPSLRPRLPSHVLGLETLIADLTSLIPPIAFILPHFHPLLQTSPPHQSAFPTEDSSVLPKQPLPTTHEAADGHLRPANDSTHMSPPSFGAIAHTLFLQPQHLTTYFSMCLLKYLPAEFYLRVSLLVHVIKFVSYVHHLSI